MDDDVFASPDERKPEKGKFYVIGPDVTGGGRGHGVILENEERLLSPPRRILRPEDGGFPVLHETPRLVLDPKEGDMPRDLEGGLSGYWLVSERLKQVFETVDPKGFAFAACDFTLADGSMGSQHYLCNIVRTLDALDEEISKLDIDIGNKFTNGKYYDLAGYASLTFKKEIVDSAHIFRTPYSGMNVFCTRILYDALKAEGLDGVRLRDAADL